MSNYECPNCGKEMMLTTVTGQDKAYDARLIRYRHAAWFACENCSTCLDHHRSALENVAAEKAKTCFAHEADEYKYLISLGVSYQ